MPSAFLSVCLNNLFHLFNHLKSTAVNTRIAHFEPSILLHFSKQFTSVHEDSSLLGCEDESLAV
jgi:hypothetical protein